MPSVRAISDQTGVSEGWLTSRRLIAARTEGSRATLSVSSLKRRRCAFAPWAWRAHLLRPGGGDRNGSAAWQANSDQRSAEMRFTDLESAVVELDDLAHHRKPQALPFDLLVGTCTALEDAPAIRTCNAGPVILDTDS